MDDKERIEKAIRQAAASIWIDNLPLSKEYVEEYRINRLKQIEKNNSQKLVLKRGGLHGKRK